MNIHKNARLTPRRREEMAVAVLGGELSKAQAARLYGVSPKIVSRWWRPVIRGHAGDIITPIRKLSETKGPATHEDAAAVAEALANIRYFMPKRAKQKY